MTARLRAHRRPARGLADPAHRRGARRRARRSTLADRAARRRRRPRTPAAPCRTSRRRRAGDAALAELADRLEPLLVYAWRRHLTAATVARMLADADPRVHGRRRSASSASPTWSTFTALVRRMSERELARGRPALRGARRRRHHRPRRPGHQDGRRRGALRDARRRAGRRHRARPRRGDGRRRRPARRARRHGARAGRSPGSATSSARRSTGPRRLTAVAQARAACSSTTTMAASLAEPLRLRADRAAPADPARRRPGRPRRCCTRAAGRRRVWRAGRHPHRDAPDRPTKETHASAPTRRHRWSPSSRHGEDGAHVAEIVLDRPEAMNAVSTAMARALAAATARRRRRRDRALRGADLAASPKAFCVGADLKERNAFTDADLMRAAAGGARRHTAGSSTCPCRRSPRSTATRSAAASSSRCPATSSSPVRRAVVGLPEVVRRRHPRRRRHPAADPPGRLVAGGADRSSPPAGCPPPRPWRSACVDEVVPAGTARDRALELAPDRSPRTRRSGCGRPSGRCGSAPTSTWPPGWRSRTAAGAATAFSRRPRRGRRGLRRTKRRPAVARRVRSRRSMPLRIEAMTRVLLAEDDPAISEPLARALRREGYDVDVRADGRAALEGARENPDLVRPRPRPAEHRRPRGVPAHPRRGQHGARADPHRPRRRGRHRRRARRRRRRLRHQAVPARRAAGPGPGPAAPQPDRDVAARATWCASTPRAAAPGSRTRSCS